MATWVIIAASMTVFFILQAIYSVRRHKQLVRTAMVRSRLAIDDEAEEEVQARLAGSVGEEAEGALAAMMAAAGVTERLQDLLDQAGERTTASAFMVRMLTFALVGMAIGGILFQSLPFAILFALTGLVPLTLVTRKRRNYMRKIDEQLPVALEIMTISLRAGHSLAKTMELSADEIQPPLSEEFARASEEHALGRSLDEVLLGMSRRLAGCRALRTFVVAVLVLQQTGGNLVEIIERIIETLRTQNQYERKLSAMTSEGKSSARMLSALPGAFLALAALGDSEYVGVLFTDPAGNKVLAGAIGLWLIGVLWTKKLISPVS